MTDEAKKLDIAQRIAEAMQCSSEPRPTCTGKFNPTEDTILGEAPEHLRHLHNLLNELGQESIDAERRFRQAEVRRDAVHTIFFDALEHHVSSDGHDGVKLCEGWQVAGFKRDQNESGLDDLIGMALRRMAS